MCLYVTGKKRPNYKREANIECRLCKGMYKDELSLIAHLTKIHAEDPTIPNYIAELKVQAKVACKICGKILGNRLVDLLNFFPCIETLESNHYMTVGVWCKLPHH